VEDGVTPPKAPDLASLKSMFEDSANLTQTARLESRKDGDYYHGFQWTKDERDALKARGQPDNVFNRVRPAVNGTLGVLKQGATDPRAYPRTPKDEESADVASKVLRFIADFNRFDDLKIRGAKDYLVEGTCAAIVEVDADLQVVVQEIAWEEFFYDPRSRREDFRDARYMGIAKWQYSDDVTALYPDADKALEASLSGGVMGDDTFEDRPNDAAPTVAWVDKKKRRVMVVELYHREGQAWQRCVFHSGGLLAYGPSAYHDDKGRSCNPIEAQSCFVDRENNRYGIVRDMRGPQDEINKRRSKLLHLLSTSQIQAVDPSAIEVDSNTARREAARPDGVIPFGWQKVNTSDMAMGQSNLLAEAKGEIERMGPNPAILGRQGESSSGRAQLVRQQAGLTEQAVIYGGVEEWEFRLYRQMWNRARQYWTAPQFIRITDDDGAPEFVGINTPPTDEQGQQGQPMAGPDGQPLKVNDQGQMDPNGKQAFIMPDGSMALGYQNALAEMDVDILLDATPDTANVQQEQFQMLVELAKMYGPQEVPFDDMLAVSAMPDKRAIIDKRKARAEQAGQMAQQQQQMQMQLAQDGAQADIENKQADTALKSAKAQTELFDAQFKADQAFIGIASPAAGVAPYGVTGVPQGLA